VVSRGVVLLGLRAQEEQPRGIPHLGLRAQEQQPRGIPHHSVTAIIQYTVHTSRVRPDDEISTSAAQ